MTRIRRTASFGLGARRHTQDLAPSKNHFASQDLPGEVKQKIASLGLVRVAGNVYECPSTKDFWKVQGNSIVRLTAEEVDNGERVAAAPQDAPADFLNDILSDLSF